MIYRRGIYSQHDCMQATETGHSTQIIDAMVNCSLVSRVGKASYDAIT
jgi:hypothetical protein